MCEEVGLCCSSNKKYLFFVLLFRMFVVISLKIKKLKNKTLQIMESNTILDKN